MPENTETRLATHLGNLRKDREWTLVDLAKRTGISRATLSRIENAEVSPTTHVLGRLCAAFDLSMSQVLAMVEDGFTPVVRSGDHQSWTDPNTGFRRQVISGAVGPLRGEVLRCHLPDGVQLAYDAPPRPGLEHHLLLERGQLTVTVDGVQYDLNQGDCLRYQLHNQSTFFSRDAADYLLFLT